MRQLISRVGATLVLVGASIALHAPAHATTCTAYNEIGQTVVVPCGGQAESTTPGKSTGRTYDPDELVTAISQVDGEICTILATITSPQGRKVLSFETFLQQIPTFGKPLHDVWAWIVEGLPGCPSLRPSATTVAWSFIRQATPPPSEPHIAPGYAITGKRAFLETRGPKTGAQTFDTLLGPLTITFEATSYTVDWGDGSGIDTGPFPIPGAPYPDGKATHVYTHARAYDVIVKTNWVAHWSVANESGNLEGLSRTERIDGFSVRQLQAVRDR